MPKRALDIRTDIEPSVSKGVHPCAALPLFRGGRGTKEVHGQDKSVSGFLGMDKKIYAQRQSDAES
jgi:hypothetical protein